MTKLFLKKFADLESLADLRLFAAPVDDVRSALVLHSECCDSWLTCYTCEQSIVHSLALAIKPRKGLFLGGKLMARTFGC